MKKRRKKFSSLRLIQNIGKAFYWFIFFAIIVLAGLIAISTLKIPGNYKLFVVQSGSMEPKIEKNAIVVVKPEKEYKKGDVITAKDLKNPKQTFTHRINDVEIVGNQILYTTKGDVNNATDPVKTFKENVLGKVIFSVPYVGLPISFARTRDGLIILVVIPATLIIYSELIVIKNETVKLIKARKKKNQKNII